MGAGHEIWKLIFDLVRNLSDVILQTLPSFWKVAKGYMEGKYQKVWPHSLQICARYLHFASRRTARRHRRATTGAARRSAA